MPTSYAYSIQSTAACWFTTGMCLFSALCFCSLCGSMVISYARRHTVMRPSSEAEISTRPSRENAKPLIQPECWLLPSSAIICPADHVMASKTGNAVEGVGFGGRPQSLSLD
jgi:hypothetical protein